MSPRIGVLALQGAFRAHELVLERLGAEAVQVRTRADLADVAGLVLPGGESTVMSLLMGSHGLRDALSEFVHGGLPILATCAGAILLAEDVLDGRPDQRSFGAIDLSVRRNGYGRQVDSFEADLRIKGDDAPFPGVFIRAPVIERAGGEVAVLARAEGPGGATPVLCREGTIMVATFHPELTEDARVHVMAFGTLLDRSVPAPGPPPVALR
jgi:5'-phosphate synthase pdxT subunit